MKTISYVDLMTEGGDLFRIEVPDKHYDALLQDIDNRMKTGDQLCPSMYAGASVTYLGIHVERINMKKIVAIL